jgi:hypothetical protein
LPDDIERTVERAKLSGSRIVNQRKSAERLRKHREAV